MTLPVFGFGHAVEDSGLVSLPLIVATTAIGAVVYAVAMVVFAPSLAHRYFQIARNVAQPIYRWVE